MNAAISTLNIPYLTLQNSAASGVAAPRFAFVNDKDEWFFINTVNFDSRNRRLPKVESQAVSPGLLLVTEKMIHKRGIWQKQ
jgi:hypothetical protein